MDLHPGHRYRIAYESESGQRTDRTIEVLRTCHGRHAAGYIRAFCTLRNEERTFRSDRILSFTDLGRISTSSQAALPSHSTHSASGMLSSRPLSRPATTLAGAPAGSVVDGPATFFPGSRYVHPEPHPTRNRPSRASSKPHTDPSAIAGKLVWGVICGLGLVFMIGAVIQYDRSSSQPEPVWKTWMVPILQQGYGNCVDFTLYTAGLLRFWGWAPYLATFFPPDGGVGHAVCFSYEGKDVPAGFSYFTLTGGSTADGQPLETGRYVPIDYEDVGSLTNAVGPDMHLKELWTPEKYWTTVPAR